MASSRSDNTMAEILLRVSQDITTAMTTPDADLQFLANLQTVILKKIREPQEQLAQLQTQGGPGPTPAPGPAAPQAGPVPSGVGGGLPGVMSTPGGQAPMADELRRVLHS